MKHFNIFRGSVLTLLLICCNAVWAYDIEVDGIYYNITSAANLRVEVTSGDKEYSGDIVIPSTITYKSRVFTVGSIGENAFYYCIDLTSVTIPNSVTSIGQKAFSYCVSLRSIEIPNSVTGIGGGAFEECWGLTSLTIPNSITDIRDSAFKGCYRLTSIEIPNSVTGIGGGAFKDCTGLTSLTIPNSITSIGNYTFSGCSSLTSINIPSSVTSIGKYAFSGCSGLTSIEIPNSMSSIASCMFKNCTGLKSIKISNSVRHIYDNAFEGCSSLKSIEIPGGTGIGYYAFYNCYSLASVTFHKNFNCIFDGFSLDSHVFEGCSSLTSIYMMDETPPPLYYPDFFMAKHYIDATLYVPNGCLEAYQNANSWNNFWDIREFDPTGIDDVKSDNENATTVYDLNGRVVENPTNGIYIIDGKKVLLK